MRQIITIISLVLGLGAFSDVASAQENDAPIITTNTTGNCVTSGSPGDWAIRCGDLNPGSGMTVIGPSGENPAPAPVEVAPAPAPAPAMEPAPAGEPAPATTDTAVATESDLDADNYPDAQEREIGLDANNPDTDGDGVADGDEGPIYGTDPFTWDTDGDGLSDGQELFATGTNPVTWDTDGDGLADGAGALDAANRS